MNVEKIAALRLRVLAAIADHPTLCVNTCKCILEQESWNLVAVFHIHLLGSFL